jgi:cytochrome c peroxidase
MFRGALLLLAGLAVVSPQSAAERAGGTVFSADELQRIRSLGPWPPAARKDPGNRVSGRTQAVELGRRLFRDPRMSPVGYIACVTCHQPDRAFTDIKARAHGLADLPRNTPSLANLRQQQWYGWTGSSDSLWMASIKPMLDPREFDGSTASVTRIFHRDPELAACYRRVFGESPFRAPHATVVNVGKALAAFVETLVTERTAFDEFRDALARNDAARASAYPMAAQRGLKLFAGRAQCIACHNGPNFSDGKFHAAAAQRAIVKATSFPALDFIRDAGRFDGARELKASAFNLLGPYNDDPSRANAVGTSRLTAHEQMRGQFRTPSLRNVAVTSPYMHDGHVDLLRDAILHAPPHPSTDGALEPLSDQEVGDLAAFLATLTDAYGERRPWTVTSRVRCP